MCIFPPPPGLHLPGLWAPSPRGVWLATVGRAAPPTPAKIGKVSPLTLTATRAKNRNNIAAAKLAGLEEDLGLSSTEYETAVSILFVGYLLMQIPSNLFLNKLGKPALYLPACMIVWGVISAATASCHNAAGLLAVRFFLGFVEAAYFPGTYLPTGFPVSASFWSLTEPWKKSNYHGHQDVSTTYPAGTPGRSWASGRLSCIAGL